MCGRNVNRPASADQRVLNDVCFYQRVRYELVFVMSPKIPSQRVNFLTD